MRYLDIVCRCIVVAMFVEMLRNEWSGVEISAFLAHNIGLGGFFYLMGWLICWPLRAWLLRNGLGRNNGRVPRDLVPEPVLEPMRVVQPSLPVVRGSNRFHARHH